MSIVRFEVTNPVWECDPTEALDHEHDNMFDGIMNIEGYDDHMDELERNDLMLQMIGERFGVCLIDGDIEITEVINLGESDER